MENLIERSIAKAKSNDLRHAFDILEGKATHNIIGAAIEFDDEHGVHHRFDYIKNLKSITLYDDGFEISSEEGG